MEDGEVSPHWSGATTSEQNHCEQELSACDLLVHLSLLTHHFQLICSSLSYQTFRRMWIFQRHQESATGSCVTALQITPLPRCWLAKKFLKATKICRVCTQQPQGWSPAVFRSLFLFFPITFLRVSVSKSIVITRWHCWSSHPSWDRKACCWKLSPSSINSRTWLISDSSQTCFNLIPFLWQPLWHLAGLQGFRVPFTLCPHQTCLNSPWSARNSIRIGSCSSDNN